MHENMKTFSSKDNLRVHTKIVHQKEKNYKCKKCGKSFGQMSTLGRHFETIHEGIRKYKCNECMTVFAEKRQLVKHNLKKHALK